MALHARTVRPQGDLFRYPSPYLFKLLLMFHRPLAFVSVLALGDYLLWNWSLNGNHDVLALVSGLTLPPLAIAFLGLLLLSLARLISHSARRSSHRHAINSTRRSRAQTASRARAVDGPRRSPGTTGMLDEDQAPTSTAASGSSSSGKLAA
jgi:hypothetical protein